jgi:hypothetical protein
LIWIKGPRVSEKLCCAREIEAPLHDAAMMSNRKAELPSGFNGWSIETPLASTRPNTRRQIVEGGAALRRAHAKHAERIRGFCDDRVTLIEYVRNVACL